MKSINAVIGSRLDDQYGTFIHFIPHDITSDTARALRFKADDKADDNPVG